MKLQLSILLFILALPARAQDLFSNLHYGPHTVGFTHYTAIDSTREYQRVYDFTDSTIYRPIPVSIWYPARKLKDGRQLVVRDYLHIVAREAEWENLPDDLLLGWFGYGTESIYQTRLEIATRATFGIPFDEGYHPVVIYSPGYERSSVENFALCEYLTSWGYVVISSPSRGTNSLSLDGGSFRDIETQTRDFEFLTREIRNTHFSGRPVSVAALGYSFGGLAGVYAAFRNKYVNTVVSLDGSIKYQYDKLKQSAYVKTENFKTPFIHFSQKDIPEDLLKAENIPTSINTDFHFFNEINDVNAHKFRMDSLSHNYFTSIGVLLRPRDPRQDPEWKDIEISYQTLCQMTLKSLGNYAVSPENSRTAHLDKTTTDTTHFTLLDRKQTTNKTMIDVMNFNDWNKIMRLENYENLLQLHSENSYLMDAPTTLYMPKEWELNTLGLKLAFNPTTYKAGVRVVEFALSVYTESANLHDTLGEIYLLNGHNEKAIIHFKQSLNLFPGNENARKRLKKLAESE